MGRKKEARCLTTLTAWADAITGKETTARVCNSVDGRGRSFSLEVFSAHPAIFRNEHRKSLVVP